jgi:hypothetical protein
MSEVPQLQSLSESEPWRLGIGLPRNALDPTWMPGPGDLLCDGQPDWEPGTRWWWCTKCGYVGNAFTQKHKPIQQPSVYFLASLFFFMLKRREAAPEYQTRVCQALFVAGAALRYAAVQGQLGPFVDQRIAAP